MPLADARAFAQWQGAYRLVERGAQATRVSDATAQNRTKALFSEFASGIPSSRTPKASPSFR